MKIVNALQDMAALYPAGQFDRVAWRSYMDALLPGIANEAEEDLRRCLATGRFTWEKDFLPVVQDAWENAAAQVDARIDRGYPT